MKITLAGFGEDLLKILSFGLIAAQAAEPVVDLTQPGIAQVYNLSIQEGLAVIGSFLGQTAAPPAAPVVAAAPARVSPVSQVSDVPAAASEPGPGLDKTVPA